MADLAAELALRNARLRAWKAHGVPVEGGWVRDHRWAILHLCCDLDDCDYSNATMHRPEIYPDPVAVVLSAEKVAVERSCPHLTPLLGEDPPEVVALTRLELLAGDPP